MPYLCRWGVMEAQRSSKPLDMGSIPCGDTIKDKKGTKMSIYRNLPKIVCSLCQTCDGWIVGSSVDNIINERPITGDIDVVIPWHSWNIASKILPRESVINSCGGFKFYCYDTQITVDVWPGDAGLMLAYRHGKALHLQTNTLLEAKSI